MLVNLEQTVREVVRHVAQSYNLTTYTHPSGNVAVTASSAVRTAPSGSLVTLNEGNIVSESFNVKSSPRIASEINYRAAYNGATGEYEISNTLRNPKEEFALGERIRLEEDMPYVYHPPPLSQP